MKRPVVFCVEEIATIRDLLVRELSADGKREVVTSPGPQFAVHKLKKFNPDLVVLSLGKSWRNSLTLLGQIMTHRPVPVIAIMDQESSDSLENDAWGRGASQVLRYHAANTGDLIEKLKKNINDLINIKVEQQIHPEALYTNIFDDNQYPAKPVYEKKIMAKSVILIGSSTGGIQIIKEIFDKLKPDLPPILIVQHMPEGFTSSLAHQMNREGSIYVKEAESGERLYHGMAIIAPGQKHLVMVNRNGGLYAELNDDQPVNRFRPSVDKLFFSVAGAMPSRVTAVLLTGMGSDGARGMMALKEQGAVTIAQDKESSPVYGMPFEATRSGAAMHSMSVEEIITHLNSLSSGS